MTTTFQIDQTQTLDMPAFMHFFDSVKGRTDIWLHTEDTKPRRIMLLNDGEFEFPDKLKMDVGNRAGLVEWTTYLDDAFVHYIGTPHSLYVIFDLDSDAVAFGQLMAATSTSVVTFFDLPSLNMPAGDPMALHNWLEQNTKGRVMVWVTAGSFWFTEIDETTLEEVEHFDRWHLNGDTSLVGVYDIMDVGAFPNERNAGIDKQLNSIAHHDPDDFLRVMFREPSEAMMFRLSWSDAERSEQPESKFA
ncbi:hypothetical protein N6H05_23780 [Sphingobium sp. WTD-1]|uniref:hypothetical protein n=1 Tax=Sphingobium sp. WTD-1 TaxID=2979467 RepID=UPI0024DE70B3|nr:hypothetical protein [Sphingobium sp. WTD-1]WIA56000.1 hypothetical protein N6H05_23780 [Sphingobium sp. WTD-1]